MADVAVNDSSPANNDATARNLTTDTAPSLPSGWSTNVGSLSGLSQFLEGTWAFTGTTGTGILTTYNPFTNGTVRSFGAWAKRTDTSATHALASSSGTGLIPSIQLDSGNQNFTFAPSIFSTVARWTATWPGNGTWYFWGVTFDGANNTVRLYINGRLVSQQSLATQWGGTNNFLSWGGSGATLINVFKGSISNPFVVEGNVTASEWAWLAGNRHDRSVSLSAATSISTAPQRELERSAGLEAITAITTNPRRELLRSASLSATTLISTSGAFIAPWNYNGGTLASYSGGNDFTYLAGTASTYGPNPDWSYGGTASPTYTYGG